MKYESDGDTNCNWGDGTDTKWLVPEMDDLEIRG